MKKRPLAQLVVEAKRRNPPRRAKTTGVRKAKNANLGKDLYYFKRSFQQAAPFAGAVGYAPLLNAYSFNLAQLPNVADFTSLFDRYMITHVQLAFYLTVEPGAQTAATATYPKLYMIRDYDDSSAPSSLNALREHSKCIVRVMNPNKPVIINIKPAITTEVYRSAVATSYSPKWNQWVDMAHTDVPHYGIKWAIDDLTNTNYKVEILGKMWFRCKDVR